MVGPRSSINVAMDWTEFDADGHLLMYFGGEGIRTFHIARKTGIPRRRVLATIVACEFQQLTALSATIVAALVIVAGRDRSGPRGVLGETPHSGHLQGRVVRRPDQQDGAAGLGDDLFRHAAKPQPRQAVADVGAQDDQVGPLGDNFVEDRLDGRSGPDEGSGPDALAV